MSITDQYLYLGQNISVRDTQDPTTEEYTTVLDLPNTTIENLAEINVTNITISQGGFADFEGTTLQNVGQGVNPTDGVNFGQLQAEIDRATGAESILTTNINAEVVRATTAEKAENARALSAESTITTNLTNEISRATAAEKSENIRAVSAESTISSNLSNEIIRAMGSEKAELSRATAAENLITTNLSTEINRATTAEKAEVLRATTSETTLALNLNNEIGRASTSEANLSQQINALTQKLACLQAKLDDLNTFFFQRPSKK